MTEDLKQRINGFLSGAFLEKDIPGRLSDAMRYSLLAGGKRLRPMLFMSTALACAPERREDILKDLMPFAAAIEMIHTYSLIHDDLPAMDDDSLRRGRPTCHVAFDEATAILAGDALLTEAFAFMAKTSAPAGLLLSAIRMMAQAAGAAGMVGGQQLDLLAENQTLSLEELNLLNAKKTGALLRCSCECGALLGGGDERQRAAAQKFGQALGIAFQITDDILDVIGDERTVGKEVRHDAKSGKATWPSLIGMDASLAEASRFCREAEDALEGIFSGPDADFLRQTARALVRRTC